MEEDFDEDTMDACLIAAGQRAEHYEMAAYGTLVAWARAMGHAKAAELLQETLDEEKNADEKLSSLAEGGINQSAAEACSSGRGRGSRGRRRRHEEEDRAERENRQSPPVAPPIHPCLSATLPATLGDRGDEFGWIPRIPWTLSRPALGLCSPTLESYQ